MKDSFGCLSQLPFGSIKSHRCPCPQIVTCKPLKIHAEFLSWPGSTLTLVGGPACNFHSAPHSTPQQKCISQAASSMIAHPSLHQVYGEGSDTRNSLLRYVACTHAFIHSTPCLALERVSVAYKDIRKQQALTGPGQSVVQGIPCTRAHSKEENQGAETQQAMQPAQATHLPKGGFFP